MRAAQANHRGHHSLHPTGVGFFEQGLQHSHAARRALLGIDVGNLARPIQVAAIISSAKDADVNPVVLAVLDRAVDRPRTGDVKSGTTGLLTGTTNHLIHRRSSGEPQRYFELQQIAGVPWEEERERQQRGVESGLRHDATMPREKPRRRALFMPSRSQKRKPGTGLARI